MAPIPPCARSAAAKPWRSSITGAKNAEDEDEARRAQAAEAHGLRQADAGGRLEAAQAREEVAEAAAAPAQEEAHRQGGPGAAASAGSLPVTGSLPTKQRGGVGRCHGRRVDRRRADGARRSSSRRRASSAAGA